jgi:hypothetical protein
MENLNPVQKRIVIALQATKQKPQFADVNFTKILLKFSKIRTTINNVKEIFSNVDDDKDGYIDEAQVRENRGLARWMSVGDTTLRWQSNAGGVCARRFKSVSKSSSLIFSSASCTTSS